MKKLLLTGASGFLGWNICKAAKDEWQVHGVIHNASFKLSGIITHQLDLTDKSAVELSFGEVNPDAVIHTAAISDANYSQQYPDVTHSINVTATAFLTELCKAKEIPFVFTSSDLVFDGKNGNYKETDDVNPLSKYGEQKAVAESLVSDIYPDAAVCRMPLMVGDGGPGFKGYLNSFLVNASKGQPLKLFTDEYRSPLGGESAAKGLLHALKNFKGIYHLGGKERLSRFELGEIITKVFSIPKSQLIPVKQSEMKMSAPRPADVSLDSSKACAEGFNPQLISDELFILQKLQLSGHPLL